MIWEKDKSEVFEEEARPLLESLKAVLERQQIPFFFCACVANTKDSDGEFLQTYVREGRTVASYGKSLPHGMNKDGAYCDEVSRHFAITCGSKVINDVEQEVVMSDDFHEDFAVPMDDL